LYVILIIHFVIYNKSSIFILKTVLLPWKKICKYCDEPFDLNPKVGDRQYACSKGSCQKARQNDNQQKYLKDNPVDYKQWYQDYGKSWNKNNPDYHKKRRIKKNRSKIKRKSHAPQLSTSALTNNKKEELTSIKLINSNSSILTSNDKKEELGCCYYLIKAIHLQIMTLDKKEELTVLN